MSGKREGTTLLWKLFNAIHVYRKSAEAVLDKPVNDARGFEGYIVSSEGIISVG